MVAANVADEVSSKAEPATEELVALKLVSVTGDEVSAEEPDVMADWEVAVAPVVAALEVLAWLPSVTVASLSVTVSSE